MIALLSPSLYQINTRVLLTNLSRQLGRPATLNDVPDAERLANSGFDWVWFLGIWQTGPAGRKVSLENPEWRREFQELLPDFRDEDVCGSCFAIQSYTVHTDFGGDAALGCLRQRIHARGMRLLLDLVPNHTAPDHPWVQQHPEFYGRSIAEPIQKMNLNDQERIEKEVGAIRMLISFARVVPVTRMIARTVALGLLVREFCMDQQYALAVLTEELKNADKRLQDTSDYLDLAIQFNRNPYPTVNTQARVRLAARAYRLAVEERATALSRLSRFTMDSAVPEDLKLRGPQKASTKPMLLRQSA